MTRGISSMRNYLRVRGEYCASYRKHPVYLGTTSACAENTEPFCRGKLLPWNYLRVRGEYHGATTYTHYILELPPRARRIQRLRGHSHRQFGTTSACAENTEWHTRPSATNRNYLRVRGEYGRVVIVSDAFLELPPRARRILTYGFESVTDFGTTSACAENTGSGSRYHAYPRNYLRVRGEYRQLCAMGFGNSELPPRARRIRGLWMRTHRAIGTTSACAENTSSPTTGYPYHRNYLRVRGEYWFGPAQNW